MFVRHAAVLLSALVSTFAAFGSHQASAQESYPSRPIRMVVGYSPGAATDIMARLVATGLQAELGQPVIVENRPGANGDVGAAYAAKAAPDGYTLMFNSTGTAAVGPHFKPKMSFHPVEDFDYAAPVADAKQVIAVSKSLGVTTLKDAIDKIKASPGKYNYGTAGLGGTQHIGIVILANLAGLKLEAINYPGIAGAVNALTTGETSIGMASVGTMRPPIESNQIVPLAVVSDKRAPQLPNVPTIVEAGMPEYLNIKDIYVRLFVATPKGVPEPILNKLNAAVQKAIQRPEIKAKFDELGQEIILNLTPAQTRDAMRKEFATWGATIKKFDIKAE